MLSLSLVGARRPESACVGIDGGPWLDGEEAAGLPGPSVVVIVGMTKENESAFSDSDYAQVRRLGEEYKKRTPRSILR
jgi:hypothetical protein